MTTFEAAHQPSWSLLTCYKQISVTFSTKAVVVPKSCEQTLMCKISKVPLYFSYHPP